MTDPDLMRAVETLLAEVRAFSSSWRRALAEREVKAAMEEVIKDRAKGGRPRTIEGEPWKAEGVSRRTWYRRKARGSK